MAGGDGMSATLWTDTYVEVTTADNFLIADKSWQLLTDTNPQRKEDYLKAISAQIDAIEPELYGTRVDTTDAQKMAFPRIYGYTVQTTGPYSVAGQKTALTRAIIAQVKYELNGGSAIGATQIATGGETVTPRQDILCREAKIALSHLWRG
jgi:hypothetical protein